MSQEYRGSVAQQLADFLVGTRFEDLPPEAVEESKRLLLDAIGCALGAANSESGKIALKFARQLCFPAEATVLGFGDRVSPLGAAFANAEMVNSLDFDAITLMSPGHVSPYVVPAALAIAEARHASGKDLILANALGHEVSLRVGSSMPYFQAVVGGKKDYLPVFGHCSTIFGGTGAVCKLMHHSRETAASALAIAGHTVPVPSVGKWSRTLPSPTVKYTVAGTMAQTELTAALLAEMGHQGDISLFEGDYGFWRFTGSSKWNPSVVTDGLGQTWHFPYVNRYKPYPTGAYAQAAMDAFTEVLEQHLLQPEEIDQVKIFAQVWLAAGAWPILTNRDISSHSDSQFSQPYAFSLIAHRVPPGPRWHDLDSLHDRRILDFMDKVVFAATEEYPDSIKSAPKAKFGFPSAGRVEVKARGQVFAAERVFPRGDPSSDQSRMTNEELTLKFKTNACRILPWHRLDEAASGILNLEKVQDAVQLLALLSV